MRKKKKKYPTKFLRMSKLMLMNTVFSAHYNICDVP